MADESTTFDPFDDHGSSQVPQSQTQPNQALLEEARRLQARQEAFRDIADRFYLVWWNLPSASPRQLDQDIVDLFRMFMDLAPSLGVSRHNIPELKECCGRKRNPIPKSLRADLPGIDHDVPIPGPPGLFDPDASIDGAQEVKSPFQEEHLGWCPGDLIRRFTRMLGFKFCQRCDDRRRRINAFFRCGR